MTQRIFDVDNPQDVKDLFDILPDAVKMVIKDIFNDEYIALYNKDMGCIGSCEHIRVNWRNKKTGIARPVDESKWIGCLCWFWDDKEEWAVLGELDRIYGSSRRYHRKNPTTTGYDHCRPARRDEIKFVEDVE